MNLRTLPEIHTYELNLSEITLKYKQNEIVAFWENPDFFDFRSSFSRFSDFIEASRVKTILKSVKIIHYYPLVFIRVLILDTGGIRP